MLKQTRVVLAEKKERIVIITLFVLLTICIPSGCTLAVNGNPTTTELHWPLKKFKYLKSGNWLASRGKGVKHLGVDMFASVGWPVSALADGTVHAVSKNGWGEKNVAVLIKHDLGGGTWFIALYGCIEKSTAPKKGDRVSAGESIGELGKPRSGKAHLHLGIAALGTIPDPPYGSSAKKNHNNFIDPVHFLKTGTAITGMAILSARSKVPPADTPPSPPPPAPAKKTKGLLWPLDRFRYSINPATGGWLARRGWGSRHLAVDMFAPVGRKVRAVADGTVYEVSRNGWGRGNVAVMIRHNLGGGKWFIALYGHMKYSGSAKKGRKVSAGEVVGKIGYHRSGHSHLHFGVVAPGKRPRAPYGNSRRKDHNNFINPVKFLKAQKARKKR